MHVAGTARMATTPMVREPTVTTAGAEPDIIRETLADAKSPSFIDAEDLGVRQTVPLFASSSLHAAALSDPSAPCPALEAGLSTLQRLRALPGCVLVWAPP